MPSVPVLWIDDRELNGAKHGMTRADMARAFEGNGILYRFKRNFVGDVLVVQETVGWDGKLPTDPEIEGIFDCLLERKRGTDLLRSLENPNQEDPELSRLQSQLIKMMLSGINNKILLVEGQVKDNRAKRARINQAGAPTFYHGLTQTFIEVVREGLIPELRLVRTSSTEQTVAFLCNLYTDIVSKPLVYSGSEALETFEGHVKTGLSSSAFLNYKARNTFLKDVEILQKRLCNVKNFRLWERVAIQGEEFRKVFGKHFATLHITFAASSGQAQAVSIASQHGRASLARLPSDASSMSFGRTEAARSSATAPIHGNATRKRKKSIEGREVGNQENQAFARTSRKQTGNSANDPVELLDLGLTREDYIEIDD